MAIILSILAIKQAIFKKDAKSYKHTIWPIIILAILLQIISFRIYNIYSVPHYDIWYNFDTVYYPLSQVVKGKTLLVNLSSQYGLYAELLNPLFQVIGLSPFTFTLIMGILQCATLLLTAVFIFNTVKNPYLILIYILATCLVTGCSWLAINLHHIEPYYQYWPIRSIFPAIGIFYFLRVAKSVTIKNVIIMSLIGGIGTIWNLDSGVPVIGAFWAYLLIHLLFPAKHPRSIWLRHLLISVITVIICWAVFFSYLHFKSGQPLNFTDVIKFQILFAIQGFVGLPIPDTLHPWMIFYAIYILGIVTAIYSWLRNENFLISDILFYLSVLGLGLFTYYQSRAHEYNLIHMTWIPLLIAILLSDRVLRLIKTDQLTKKWRWLVFPTAFIGTMIAGDYLLAVPLFLKDTNTAIRHMRHHQSSPLIENIKFIREYTIDPKSVVILANNQGIYYGETGLASATNGPSLSENIFPSDNAALFSQLLNQPIKNIFIEKDLAQPPHLYQSLLEKYQIKHISNGGMVDLVPKDDKNQ